MIWSDYLALVAGILVAYVAWLAVGDANAIGYGAILQNVVGPVFVVGRLIDFLIFRRVRLPFGQQRVIADPGQNWQGCRCHACSETTCNRKPLATSYKVIGRP